jgi:riboflavin synthase alpha subunit
MVKRGRPVEEPKEEQVKFTQVIKHSDGAVTTWYWDKSIRTDGPIKTVTKWPKGALDFEQVQEALPKTKRKYALDDGRIVGYTRAKALGVI